MEQTFRKTSIRIWQPALERFNERINSACLRRDAYLSKLLELELDELDAASATPNSVAVQQYISSRLDALPRKLVTLTLPDELVHRLDDICARKRIVRDSFFNRLFFLLAADRKLLTHLFFAGDWSWLYALQEHSDFGSSAAGEVLDPIPNFRDPFYAIRSACQLPDWQGPDGIYTGPITANTFSSVDLSGLNVYLSDDALPAAAAGAPAISLDDLLPRAQPTSKEPS
jgi:hypothetical protein